MRGKYYTPVAMAYTKDLKIDYEGNKRIIEHLINGGKGIDGILFLGSTGDFFAFDKETKKQFIDFVVKTANKRVDILIGTGGMDMNETIELTNYATKAGVHGVLIVNHYYFAQPEASQEHFFSTVAEKCPDARIYFYNYPARTGIYLKPQMVARLANKYKNIVGIKNSTAMTQSTREMIETVKRHRPDFEVFTGYDEHFLWNMFSGGDGVMGALSNIAPGMCYEWAEAIDKKDYPKMIEIQRKINKMNCLYDLDTYPNHILKRAMQLVGVKIEDYMPEPFLPVSKEQEEKIAAILKDCGLM